MRLPTGSTEGHLPETMPLEPVPGSLPARRKVTFSLPRPQSCDSVYSIDDSLVGSVTSEEWNGGANTPCTLAALQSNMRSDQEDHFASFIAILSNLPMHAPVKRRFCCQRLRLRSNTVEQSCSERVDAVLQEACDEYPQFAGELRALSVVGACADFSFFADHGSKNLFMAVRGTDFRVCRDICNDIDIALGYPPRRAACADREYRKVRSQFSQYASFGCGHSLGGSIMHELAYNLEKESDYAFVRVDVFNAGGSPLRRRYTALNRTEFNSHRVVGDLVSLFYEPPGGKTIEHDRVPNIDAHRLVHFLPIRRARALSEAVAKQLVQWMPLRLRSFGFQAPHSDVSPNGTQYGRVGFQV